MGALEEIRDETDDLVDDAQDDFKASLRGNAKRTVIIVAIIIVAVAALVFAVNCIGQNEERQALRDYQARENFRAQYFEELDRLYEAGDDDELSRYVWSLMNDPGYEAIFSWKHIGLLEAHDGWESLRSAEKDIEAGTCKLDDYTWLVSLALRLSKLDEKDTSLLSSLSQEDEARAVEYRAYAVQFLKDTLQMTEQEIVAFADESRDVEGYITESELRRNLEERLKQLGTPY